MAAKGRKDPNEVLVAAFVQTRPPQGARSRRKDLTTPSTPLWAGRSQRSDEVTEEEEQAATDEHGSARKRARVKSQIEMKRIHRQGAKDAKSREESGWPAAGGRKALPQKGSKSAERPAQGRLFL